jgi:DNA-binding winged helix-turn-helix (wHTH) protein
MDAHLPLPAAVAFSDFTLLPRQRLLLRSGSPVAIGARAFDLLVLLVSRAGEVLDHRTLVAGVWPRTVVIEANLRVQIAALRKLPGMDAGAIVNVVGRGYTFVGEVRAADGSPDTAPRNASIVAGLVRCTSKPAASARVTSAAWP